MAQMTVGGWRDQDANDKVYQDMSWRIMKKINSQSNDLYHLMPIKVLSAKSQVVAGMKHEVELLELSVEEFGPEKCKEKEGGYRRIYVVSVWEKPWEDFEEITIKESKEA
uniref:Cystatin domain-containing protein n=1 Tax=Syphacia muris TaxID=451379 RepID=A0A0N5AK79_9BILA